MRPGHSSAKPAIPSPFMSCLASEFSAQASKTQTLHRCRWRPAPSSTPAGDSVLLRSMPSFTPLSPGIPDAGLINPPSLLERKQSIRCRHPSRVWTRFASLHKPPVSCKRIQVQSNNRMPQMVCLFVFGLSWGHPVLIRAYISIFPRPCASRISTSRTFLVHRCISPHTGPPFVHQRLHPRTSS